jgi:hypothetical protein
LSLNRLDRHVPYQELPFKALFLRRTVPLNVESADSMVLLQISFSLEMIPKESLMSHKSRRVPHPRPAPHVRKQIPLLCNNVG